MGNRAVITFKDNRDLGLYLHWNGGRDSIESFLEYTKLKGVRNDVSYQHARLCQVIGNFMGGNNSLGSIGGKGNIEDMAAWADNGLYIVDKDLNIVERDFLQEGFVEQQDYSRQDMLCAIDSCQPQDERINIEQFLNSSKVSLSQLEVGDTLLVQDKMSGIYRECEILGFGLPGQICNGTDVSGLPFTDEMKRYDNLGMYVNKNDNEIKKHFSENINCYITDGSFRKVESDVCEPTFIKNIDEFLDRTGFSYQRATNQTNLLSDKHVRYDVSLEFEGHPIKIEYQCSHMENPEKLIVLDDLLTDARTALGFDSIDAFWEETGYESLEEAVSAYNYYNEMLDHIENKWNISSNDIYELSDQIVPKLLEFHHNSKIKDSIKPDKPRSAVSKSRDFEK